MHVTLRTAHAGTEEQAAFSARSVGLSSCVVELGRCIPSLLNWVLFYFGANKTCCNLSGFAASELFVSQATSVRPTTPFP